MIAELFRNARKLVKEDKAFAAWTIDGQPMIKWSEDATSKPVRILSSSDLIIP